MKDMIRKYRNLSVICLAAASLLAACSEDEPVDGDSLPAGLYPVEIASVAISGGGSAQPWGADSPQTRAGETGDGTTTSWSYDGTEKIYVKFSGGDKTGTYRIKSDWGIDNIEPLYWRSRTKEENIIAWFTQPETDDDGNMDIADQSKELAYVLRDDTTATYTTDEVKLNFKHRLAKVRVYVQGTGYTGNATGVTINNVPTSCTVTEGVPVADAPISGKGIQMYKTSVNNAVCFEANVLSGTIGTDNTFTVTLDGGTTQMFTRTTEQTLTVGEVFTTNLRLQTSGTEKSIDLSSLSNTYEISGSGTYFFYGTGPHGIKVTSGSPKIYLANAEISVTNGNAIDITGGSPTINIQGNVSVKSSNGAGIFVASNNTVTIQSSGRNDNVLTAEAGGEAAGIGGSATNGTGTNCGNITIKDIRLYAYGSSGSGGGACPGIGGAGSGTCGTIKIQDSAVYAYGTTSGNNHAPGIGSAQPANGESPDAPRCVINGSTIQAYRGYVNNTTSYADYIGQGGNPDSRHGSSNDGVNLGGGSCSSSYIYGYTDTTYKTIYYNASGDRT